MRHVFAMLFVAFTGCAPFDARITSDAGATDAHAAPRPPAGADATRPGGDGAGGGGPCGEPVSPPPGNVFGSRASVSLDGDLGEWSCASFARLDRTTAARSEFGSTGAHLELAAGWTEGALFFAARVRDDPTAKSGNTTRIFANDCIHLHLDLDRNANTFTKGTKHLLVDHRAIVRDDSKQTEMIVGPANVSARTTPQPGGFDLEVQIDSAYLGSSPFVAGQQLKFDFAVTDGNGDQVEQFLIWQFRDGLSSCRDDDGSICGCNLDLPACDVRHFGILHLSQ